MDVLLPKVTRYNQVFEDLISKTEKIERQYGAKNEILDLRATLVQEKSSTEELIEEITTSKELKPEERKKLEDKMKILEEQAAVSQERIAQLERELGAVKIQLKETKSELNEMKLALQTGQLAYDFEKDLAKYIYPNHKKIGSRKIFTNMLEWLTENTNTDEGREANEKWDRLKTEFSWSSAHEDVFFKLIQKRLTVAHPDFEWETVKAQNPNSYTDEENKCIKDICDMYIRVNDLII